MKESAIREQLVMHGRSLYDRGLAGGSTGNMSVRLEEGGFIATPTNACLGRLDPARLSKLDAEGRHVDGDKPTKETFLHFAMYCRRPRAGAVVHLHCTHSVAVSCLAGLDAADVLPAITPYYVMRIGKCPLVPYFRPGDEALGAAVAELAGDHHAVLLANHGPVVSGSSLDAAVYALEELEETARLFFLLRGHDVRRLTDDEVADLKAHFPLS
jgi:ribulose-5-phosphate 4-epimerase/fuculose-1-phosphate aldolase